MHEIRTAKDAAKQGSDTARKMYSDLASMYHESLRMRRKHPPSAKLRRYMEDILYKMISRYRDYKDEHVRKVIARLETSWPDLFTFLEYDGVDPTNNATERALRYPVAVRKTSGQIKGDGASLRRKSDFWTYVMTWMAQGKNIAGEIAALM